MSTPITLRRTWLPLVVTIVIAASIAIATPASAQLAPPWNGDPISAGLGPTYGEAWCADPEPGSNIANQQDKPLALIPVEAIQCTLDDIIAHDAGTGADPRMEYEAIGQSATGRDLFGVVVNALDTPQQ